jgi:nitrate reductase gamma subunit
MSEALHFAEHRLQEIALLIMAAVYITRLLWLFRFKGGRERQPKTGLPGTTKAKGILYSWLIIAMPWAMESTRKKFLLYLQFVVFHLGVVFAIGLSFVIPYLPKLLDYPYVIPVTQVFIGAAFIVGVLRIIRRMGGKYMRAISSPDDYFSLLLLTAWFLFAFLATPNNLQDGEAVLLTYFILTAFFLIYVPFSKISHYLYYPFTRYWFGKSMGYRGTYPLKRGPSPHLDGARRASGVKSAVST